MVHPEQSYREYVAGNLDRLRRTAFLLCGDWHTADDLTSTVLVKLFRHWKRVGRFEHLDAYVRRMLMRAWLDERRRPWRRETSTDALPERTAGTAGGAMPARVERDPHWVAAYDAGFNFHDQAHSSGIGVTLYASSELPADLRNRFQPCVTDTKRADCRSDTVGGIALIIHREHRSGVVTGYQVDALRPDGTGIILTGRSADPDNVAPPFTEAQLIRIATAPELTLYP